MISVAFQSPRSTARLFVVEITTGMPSLRHVTVVEVKTLSLQVAGDRQMATWEHDTESLYWPGIDIGSVVAILGNLESMNRDRYAFYRWNDAYISLGNVLGRPESLARMIRRSQLATTCDKHRLFIMDEQYGFVQAARSIALDDCELTNFPQVGNRPLQQLSALTFKFKIRGHGR